MDVAHQAFRQLVQLAQIPSHSRGNGTLPAQVLQPQLERRQVLSQPVVQFARDAAPLGFLGFGQAPQHQPVRLLGALALADFRLQHPVERRKVGRALPDFFFQLVALLLQRRLRLFERLFAPLPLDGVADGTGGLPPCASAL